MRVEKQVAKLAWMLTKIQTAVSIVRDIKQMVYKRKKYWNEENLG